MEIRHLTNEEQLEEFLGQEECMLLKHSATCPISAGAYQEFQRFAGKASIPLGLIVVQESRSLSNQVAERTGVKHESPQVLHFKKGQVRWHTSHRNITEKALESQVD